MTTEEKADDTDSEALDVPDKRRDRRMNIERRFERKSFEDLEPGVLFAGMIGGGRGVHAIKAYAPADDDSTDAYFVTVGPFDEEIGSFPVQYHPNALHRDPVLELIGGYQISPSLSPGDLVSELPLDDSVNGVLLILQENQILMSVAAIDSINRIHRRWLDVGTGEILPPLRHADYIVTRRWRITAPVENAAPETIFEFNAEIEST